MSQNKPITRSVSTSSVSSEGNNNKRPRDDGLAMEESDGDILSKIEQMFAASYAKIEAKIDSSNSKLEQRIGGVETMLTALKRECTENINSLSKTVTEVRCEIQSTAQRMDRFEKANDLIISGIPYSTNENLGQLFYILAKALAYNDLDRPIVDLKRLMRLPIAAGATPPIVCQFAFKNARDAFYGRYLKARNLTLRHLGFDSDLRVFLNENLTQHARDIRTYAVKMKKKRSAA